LAAAHRPHLAFLYQSLISPILYSLRHATRTTHDITQAPQISSRPLVGWPSPL
jgi:hypothetical protein